MGKGKVCQQRYKKNIKDNQNQLQKLYTVSTSSFKVVAKPDISATTASQKKGTLKELVCLIMQGIPKQV